MKKISTIILSVVFLIQTTLYSAPVCLSPVSQINTVNQIINPDYSKEQKFQGEFISLVGQTLTVPALQTADTLCRFLITPSLKLFSPLVFKISNLPGLKTVFRALGLPLLFLSLFLFLQTTLFASDIRFIPQTDGAYQLSIDGEIIPRSDYAGIVWQHVPKGEHISDYTNSGRMPEMYARLLPQNHPVLKEIGLSGQSGMNLIQDLEAAKIKNIRVYYMPVDKEGSEKVKKIFRALHKQYGLKVMIGHWAGLWALPGTPECINGSSADLEAVKKSVQTLIETYGEENWVISFQIGNENNYHAKDETGNVKFSWRGMNLNQKEYYAFMNELAITAKKVQASLRKKTGRTDINIPVILGNGDLSHEEAEILKKMKEQGTLAFDSLGINFYGGVFGGSVKHIQDIGNFMKEIGIPFYLSEVGSPYFQPEFPKPEDYFNALKAYLPNNLVLGFAFAAYDEAWKSRDSGKQEEAHFGLLKTPGIEAFINLFKTEYSSGLKLPLSLNLPSLENKLLSLKGTPSRNNRTPENKQSLLLPYSPSKDLLCFTRAA